METPSRAADIDAGEAIIYSRSIWWADFLGHGYSFFAARTPAARPYGVLSLPATDRPGSASDNGGNNVATIRYTPFDWSLFSFAPLAPGFGDKTRTSSTSAATPPDYYWDVNGSAAGFGGTGTWDAKTNNKVWNNSTGAGTALSWTNSSTNNAFLQGTAGVVTMGAAVVAGTVTVSTTNYELTASGTSNGLTAGSLSLGSGVALKLTLNSGSTGTAAWSFGSISGDSTLTLNTGATTAGNVVAVNITSTTTISLPISITATGSPAGATGLIANGAGNTVLTLNSTVTNNTSAPTLLGAATSNALTLGGRLTGSAGVDFSTDDTSGGGGVVLLNTNTSDYTGSTRILNAAAGIVRIGIDNALPVATALVFGRGVSSSGNSVGALDLNGHNLQVGSLATNLGGSNTANGITNTVAGTLSTLTVSGNASTTFAAVIGIPTATAVANASNNIALTLGPANTGTLALTGANTYSGKTTIGGGTLSVGSLNRVSGGSASSNLGTPNSVANGTIDIGSGTSSGTLRYTGAGQTTDRVINLAGSTGGATLDQSGSGTLTFSSDFTATGAGSKTLTLQGSTAGIGTISGAIVDNSAANKTAVTKSGSGTWALSGTNTYSGGTTINGGVLQVSSDANLGSSAGTATIGAGTLEATADISNSRAFLLQNAGSTILVDAAKTFTLNGTMGDGSAAGKLNKSGAGTLVLTGGNSYTGGTAITAGTLLINNTSGSATGTGTIAVTSTGTLGGSGMVAGGVTVGDGVNNAILAPGSAGDANTGRMQVGSLTLASNSTLSLNLTSTTELSGYDQVASGNSMSIGGNLSLIIGAPLNIGDKFYVILNTAGTNSGSFANAVGGIYNQDVYSFAIDYNDVTYTGGLAGVVDSVSLTVTAVPEPGTWLAAALALGTGAFTRRKAVRGRTRRAS